MFFSQRRFHPDFTIPCQANQLMSQMRTEMEQIKAEISQMKEKCKTVMDRGTTGTSHQQHQQGTTNHTTSQ
jgi:hypothetical protein